MPLTNTSIRNAKPANRPLKLFDGHGLFLLITPAGRKWWRLKYRFAGKEKALSMGVYPDIGLKAAREQRYEARKLLARGTDPADVRREQKARETAARRTSKDTAKVRVSAFTNGGVEIWKGRAVLPLTIDEARAVNNLLTKLLD